MPAGNRTVDLLVGAFDLNQRRKFELKNEAGEKVIDLFFKPSSLLALMRRWT